MWNQNLIRTQGYDVLGRAEIRAPHAIGAAGGWRPRTLLVRETTLLSGPENARYWTRKQKQTGRSVFFCFDFLWIPSKTRWRHSPLNHLNEFPFCPIAISRKETIETLITKQCCWIRVDYTIESIQAVPRKLPSSMHTLNLFSSIHLYSRYHQVKSTI